MKSLKPMPRETKCIETLRHRGNPVYLNNEINSTAFYIPNVFIFSFKTKNNFKDAIFSNIRNIDYELNYHAKYGPCFGSSDIITYTSNEVTDYDTNYCNECHYEKEIRDTETRFFMEDYEVFQIIKR